MSIAYNLRKAQDGDGNSVAKIFNYYVEAGFAAFPEKPVGMDFLEKLRGVAVGDIFYVLEEHDSNVFGFGLLKRYHDSDVFSRVAEIGYFILPEYVNKGIGSKLLDALIVDAKRRGVDTLLAAISSLNEASIRFHKKNGFIECGRFERIGNKRGSDFDVVWMQRFI